MVVAGRHYGMTIRTCMPADPQSKGGAEATVRIAKADLVPTEANLREAYGDFAALEAACAVFCLPRRPGVLPPPSAKALETASYRKAAISGSMLASSPTPVMCATLKPRSVQ